MSKRTIVSVRWKKGLLCWSTDKDGGPADPSLFCHYSKSALVRLARRYTRKLAPSQLRVFNKNGRIAFEHTYPRSSDPRRHKG